MGDGIAAAGDGMAVVKLEREAGVTEDVGEMAAGGCSYD